MRFNLKVYLRNVFLVLVSAAILSCSIDTYKEGSKTIAGSVGNRTSGLTEDLNYTKLIVGLKETSRNIDSVVSEIEGLVNSNNSANSFYSTNSYIQLERVHSTTQLKKAIKSSSRYSVMSESEVVQEAYNNLTSEIEKALYRDFKFQVPKDIANEIISKLEKNPDISYIQKDNLNVLYENPNDTHFRDGSLWGLTKTHCDQAWDVTKGNNVIVAVIDSGVDGNHPDLVDNLWTSPQGTWGYDFSDKDDYPSPDGSHGTHVAGTIAAVGNNGRGVIGVAPNVTIMALKIFPKAYSSVCADAIRYAVDNGAKVLNNSWGPRDRQESDPTIENAIRYAHSKGAVVVFAAGNSNDDAQYYYGGNSPYTVCVAAVDSNFNRASFSNYGSVVDIAAPGVSIKSTVPNGSYENKSGTSMAAPHIAGLAALILSKNPSYTNEQVLNKMKSSVIPVSATNIGSGVMNAYKAVQGGGGDDTEAPTVPTQLTSSNITSSSIDLSWQKSTDNKAVTGYRVYKDGVFVKTVSVTNTSINSLNPDTTYRFEVSAVDAAGNESPKAQISEKTLPGIGGTDWKAYVTYNTGDVVTYSGNSYRCLQAHTSLPGWDPVNVPALWQKI